MEEWVSAFVFDLLMLALIVAGFAAATVYAQLCDGLVRRPTGNAETEN